MSEKVFLTDRSMRIKPKKMVVGEKYHISYNGKEYMFLKPEKNVVDIYVLEEKVKEIEKAEL